MKKLTKDKLYSRKEMLELTKKSLLGVGIVGVVPSFLAGCNAEEAKDEEKVEVEEKVASSIELPAKEVLEYEYIEKSGDEAPFPYPYQKLDKATAMERAHAGFYNKGGCCRAVADGVIGELADKAGYPFNQIPIDMFANGAGGYGAGTLCGALGGGVAAIGLVCEPDDAKKVTQELFKWYTSEELPNYQPTVELDKVISKSVNCEDSVVPYMDKADVKMGDDIRLERCACLSGDVAGKTVELLNEHFNL